MNSDDRAAHLNGGLYHNITPKIRAAAGRLLQESSESHIEARRSFAFENALRTGTGFKQIRRAKDLGFRVVFNYLAAGPVEEHMRRVMNRAVLGVHSATEGKLRNIYEHSMKSLVVAFGQNPNRRVDLLRIFDNSAHLIGLRLVVRMQSGIARMIAPEIPAWLDTALANSQFSIERLRDSRLAHTTYFLNLRCTDSGVSASNSHASSV